MKYPYVFEKQKYGISKFFICKDYFCCYTLIDGGKQHGS